MILPEILSVLFFLSNGVFVYLFLKKKKFSRSQQDAIHDLEALVKSLHDRGVAHEVTILDQKTSIENCETTIAELENKNRENKESIEEYESLHQVAQGLLEEAKQKIENLQNFYEDTIEDLTNSRDIFDQLVNTKEYLSDDPAIVQIKQVFAVTLDILEGYVNARKERTEEETEQKEE